jgi:hypothetical protein
MAQFWGLQRLTAATIEAPEADAGDVLTADGAGGAAFAAPAGGGGAAFDEVVFTIIEGSIKLDLLANGIAVDRAAFWCFVCEENSNTPVGVVTLGANAPTTLTPIVTNIGDGSKALIFVNYDSSASSLTVFFGSAVAYCLSVLLPSGAVATSGVLLDTPAP